MDNRNDPQTSPYCTPPLGKRVHPRPKENLGVPVTAGSVRVKQASSALNLGQVYLTTHGVESSLQVDLQHCVAGFGAVGAELDFSGKQLYVSL